MERITKSDYIDLIKKSLDEDLSNIGDVTTDSIFDDSSKSEAVLVSKDNGILCGIDLFKDTFMEVDPELNVKILKHEGEEIGNKDFIAIITGKTKSILKAERTAINLLSFLSGISTATSLYVKAASSTGKTKILDTRKTLPGYRVLSKYAVKVAGGENHRMGLHDMVLIKDNHIMAAGSISMAVAKARLKWQNKYKIEVEVKNFEELKEAVAAKVDMIMLDNMSVEQMDESVKFVNKKIPLEASGNMNIEKVKTTSKIGVDFISVGALTHSVKAFDFSLLIEKELS